MSMTGIEIRQNEERMLRYQYASRKHYNCAETLNNLVWMCCFIAWLTIFVPSSSTWGMNIIAVPFCLNIIAEILYWRMIHNVYFASAYRKYFDAYVFGFNLDHFTKSEVQKLEERSIKTVKHRPRKSKEQMANTGRDNPPGVRNWYEFSKPLSKQDAIYECQKQNCWWYQKITQKRIISTVIIILVLVTVAIGFMVGTKTGLLLIIYSSSGLIIMCARRIAANVNYYKLSLKIDGALDVLTNSRSDKNIKNLQAKIDARRAMPVLERNYFHKHHAKEYSELYHDITAVHK